MRHNKLRLLVFSAYKTLKWFSFFAILPIFQVLLVILFATLYKHNVNDVLTLGGYCLTFAVAIAMSVASDWFFAKEDFNFFIKSRLHQKPIIISKRILNALNFPIVIFIGFCYLAFFIMQNTVEPSILADRDNVMLLWKLQCGFFVFVMMYAFCIKMLLYFIADSNRTPISTKVVKFYHYVIKNR